MPLYPRTLATLAAAASISLAALGPSTSLAAASPVRPQAARAPTAAEKKAIEHVIVLLIRSLRARHYGIACQQYSRGDRALFVFAAQHSGHALTHTCAQALALLVKAHGSRPTPALARTHFKRITISGSDATVTITEAGHRVTLPLTHGQDGWKIGITVTSKRS